jgi:glycosyltransferase involved in cell wall biosynthesis
MGRLERLDEFFSALDLFCLPSQLEGFGLVYVEAAMRGVPSVALNVGGVSDAVIHGRTGLLVADHDLNGVRHSLIRLKEDEPLRLRLGSAARQRAMTELDEGTMSRRFLELFQRQTTKRRATDRRP